MRFFPLRAGRGLVVAVTSSTLLLAGLAAPNTASADDSATLTVVGTSDVFDSNLVQTVLKPGFEARYPQYTLNYVSKGTGAAIAYAEAGTASALLVHAASLENQFVAAGYSKEKYGRAIFWGDYVLVGPASDPAGVMTNASHDIVTAFERIAAAGATNTADFVSRGGTPGTTVQEHAIWALTQGVTQCTVSDTNGGGTAPNSTSGACPTSTSDPSWPAWYHQTGLTQGPNVTNASACNYSGRSGACYVFTDRGTFNYLQSTGVAQNLHIVTRDNDAAARGGGSLLVNSFHAYAIDPAKFAGNPAVVLNLPAATAFLNWVTSPAGQSAVGAFLSSGGDPPFLPSAAPQISTSTVPKIVRGGKGFKVSGTVSNAVPGTPALSDVTVNLMSVKTAHPKADPVKVDTTKTSSKGHYSLSYTPRVNRTYFVSTPAVTKVENSTLNPVFGDLLASGATSLGRIQVRGVPHIGSVRVSGRSVSFTGTLKPTVKGIAHLRLYGVRAGKAKTHDVHFISGRTLHTGDTAYSVRFTVPAGAWHLQLKYVNSKRVLGGFSKVKKVTVG